VTTAAKLESVLVSATAASMTVVNVSAHSWTVRRWKLETDALARDRGKLINLVFAFDTIIYNEELEEHVSMQKYRFFYSVKTNFF
jgi:hypothetical protein